MVSNEPLEANFVTACTARHAPPGLYYHNIGGKGNVFCFEYWLKCAVRPSELKHTRNATQAIEKIMAAAIARMATWLQLIKV